AITMPTHMPAGRGTLEVSRPPVLAGGRRTPIAQEHPLLRPAGWHGLRFSVIRSNEHAAAIRALGAVTTDIWGSARQDAVGAGRVDGFEMHYKLWSFVIAPSAIPYVAANVNLWPETAAL